MPPNTLKLLLTYVFFLLMKNANFIIFYIFSTENYLIFLNHVTFSVEYVKIRIKHYFYTPKRQSYIDHVTQKKIHLMAQTNILLLHRHGDSMTKLAQWGRFSEKLHDSMNNFLLLSFVVTYLVVFFLLLQ